MIKTYLLPLFLSAQTWDMCFKWLFFYVYMLFLCTSTDLILCVLLDILGEYHSYWPLTRLVWLYHCLRMDSLPPWFLGL